MIAASSLFHQRIEIAAAFIVDRFERASREPFKGYSAIRADPADCTRQEHTGEALDSISRAQIPADTICVCLGDHNLILLALSADSRAAKTAADGWEGVGELLPSRSHCSRQFNDSLPSKLDTRFLQCPHHLGDDQQDLTSAIEKEAHGA